MSRVINITPFEEITNINLNECISESPLKGFELPRGMFKKKDDIFGLDNWDTDHWELILNNRIISINRNFGYAMFYYYKGIPDDEWFISPGKEGQSVEFFPHFDDQHTSNHFNFKYFVDIFFLKAYTVYETIGHLLYKLYDLEINEDDPRDQVSFKSAIFKLKPENHRLYKDLCKLKRSDDFKKGVAMRNDIAHNHPPYDIDSGVTKSKGGIITMGIGNYTTSKEIKETMIDFLRSIKVTFEMLEKHLPLS